MKNTKKKAVVGAIIGIAVLLIGLFCFKQISNRQLIKKANLKYGTYQKCDIVHDVRGEQIDVKCKLCNSSVKAIPGTIICESCSFITNRCDVCGKINAKEKRTPRFY